MPDIGLFVVMGPSGCGKTTLGEWLAKELKTEMLEGDSFHPQENIMKMSKNIPLNDDDRWPWLNKIRQMIISETEKNSSERKDYLVVSCSALKKTYRDCFRNISGVKTRFVFLDGSFELLKERMLNRKDHYMKADMLKSQFDTLEIPKEDENDVITIPLGDERFMNNNSILEHLFID